MSTLILFPGLGANAHLFSSLHFGDHRVYVAEFLVPEKDEELQHYCRRLIEKFPYDTSYVFIGVSFGGILAQEAARMVHARKVIIISSLKNTGERPFYFSLLNAVPVYKVIPVSVMKPLMLWLSRWVTPKSKTDQEIFLSLVHSADPRVVRWGLDQVIRWRKTQRAEGLIHIHGNKDRVLPARNIKADYVIEGGSHFMIVQRAPEINRLLMQLIEDAAKGR